MSGPLRAGARVVVTGAAGRHGRLVLSLLRGRGHDLVASDAAPFPDCPADVRFVQADLCDADATEALLRGADAVVHLAAVPGPSATPPPGVDPAWSAASRIGLERLSPAQVLQRNVASAWHVFEGAARAGASRVVFSSSAFCMGFSHDPAAFQPRYLPLDEAHPALPLESYGLSKLLGEEAAAATARIAARTVRPLSIASLRFTNLVYPEAEATLPWVAPSDAAPASALMWCWARAAEVAHAHVLALEAPSVGPEPHEAFLLAAPTTRFAEDTAALAARWYPGVPLARSLRGNASVIATDKAQRLLGWRPTTAPALLRA
jgi:nucleoside-diphosphate-sugar epimerase